MLQRTTDVWQVFGDFWERAWQQPGLPSSMANSWARAFEEWSAAAAAMAAHSSLAAVPLAESNHWIEITFLETDITRRRVRFGEFTFGVAYTFGMLAKQPFLYGVPDKGYMVAGICDNPATPTELLWNAQDFTQADGRVWLLAHPDNLQFRKTVVPDSNGEPVASYTMWLCLPKKTSDTINKNFGYPAGAAVPADETGRRVLMALWRALTDGGTNSAVNALLSAAVDSDVQPVDGVVNKTWTEGGRGWVATGDALATLQGGIVPTTGTLLEAGSLLTAAVRRLTGTIAFADLRAMRLDAGMLTPGVPGGVVLENQTIALDWAWMSPDPLVSVDVVAGLVYVTGPSGASAGIADETTLWEYGVAKVPIFECGMSADAALAWRRAMAAGILETGVDLFAAMSAGSAPPHSFNPFQFFKDNFFGQNHLFARLDPACLIAPGLVNLTVRAAADSLAAGSTLLLLWEAVGEDACETTDTAHQGLLLAEGVESCAVGEFGLAGSEYLF